jgi:hypothetical protein
MSIGTYENRRHYEPAMNDEWDESRLTTRRSEFTGSSLALPVAALVALGLGALAWYYLGPDLRRYLKLRSM